MGNVVNKTESVPLDHDYVSFQVKTPREFYWFSDNNFQVKVLELGRDNDIQLVTASKEKWLSFQDRDFEIFDPPLGPYLHAVFQTIREKL